MRKISVKQREIYDFILDFTGRQGYPPSIREICAAVGLKSPSSVHTHIKTLQEAGYIKKEDNKTRALIPATGSAFYGKIPVLGRVTAGEPILAIEEVEGYLPFDADGMSGNFFALRVRGDSMIEAGINSDDYVIVHEQPTAENGDIVVALLGEEATVKTLRIGNGDIWLMPRNPIYEPIDGSECVIIGVVKALYRKY
ncbi:MAG: transcriptional repressor LexA [Oscillospiraceae bacterium]|jgi:repressor LexA|nr:transcriptional repressor LexA [Oscillospiraceae bacterium]